MYLSFTEALPTEAKKIENLYKQLINDPHIQISNEHLTDLLSDNYNFLFVLKQDEQLIATAFLTICRDPMYGNQPFAILENIIVDSEFQSLGFGVQLMDHIKTYCLKRKCTKIMFLSSIHRVRAHQFFEKCGYQSHLKNGFVNYINR